MNSKEHPQETSHDARCEDVEKPDIAAIALVLRIVTKKDTHGRAGRKLSTLNRRKENKTDNQKCVDGCKREHKNEGAQKV